MYLIKSLSSFIVTILFISCTKKEISPTVEKVVPIEELISSYHGQDSSSVDMSPNEYFLIEHSPTSGPNLIIHYFPGLGEDVKAIYLENILIIEHQDFPQNSYAQGAGMMLYDTVTVSGSGKFNMENNLLKIEYTLEHTNAGSNTEQRFIKANKI